MAPTEQSIADLFERWNTALASQDPEQVVACYAEDAILLPTLSNQPRFTRDEKLDYFRGFLAKQPLATIVTRRSHLGEAMAVDSGIYAFDLRASGDSVRARYTFTYQWRDEDWLIVSHHSSGMPED